MGKDSIEIFESFFSHMMPEDEIRRSGRMWKLDELKGDSHLKGKWKLWYLGPSKNCSFKIPKKYYVITSSETEKI